MSGFYVFDCLVMLGCENDRGLIEASLGSV